VPGPDQYPVKSPGQAYVAGSTLRFHSFVPRRGPNGGRAVIDGFELVAVFADITVATTAIQGADLWRSFKRIQIEQAGGILRWNAKGDESRQLCYLLEGANRVREVADSGTTANQAFKVAVYIPLERQFAVEPRDYSLPADLLSELRIDCADTGELDDDGGTVTIAASGLSYYVIAWCHEEFSVRVCPHDLVGVTALPATTGMQLPVQGRLHDLAFMARGTSGGASMANLTDVRIDTIMPVAITREELLGQYMRDRFNANNLNSADGGQVRQDPFNAGRGVPVLWTTKRSSVFDGPILDQVGLTLTNTVSNTLCLWRVVKPRDPYIQAAVADRYGISEGEWRVKTKGKSKRARTRWHPEQEAFLPLVAPLKR
jgi:hypothetical protein